MARDKRQAGGSAASGGFTFQHNVAAWFATSVLAEKAAALRWGLPSNTYLEYLRCETDEPVDDILVGTSDKGLIFVQVKKSLRLSDKANSPLASALDQFVRQYCFSLSRAGSELWERPLDIARDRLLLITDGNAPAWATNDLPTVLDRIRMEPQLSDIRDAAQTETEEKALGIVLGHIVRSWLGATGSSPGTTELRQLLSFIWIDILDLDRGGRDELAAINLLKTGVVRKPNEGELAYGVIQRLCEHLAKARAGTGLSGLQKELLKNGVLLDVPLGLRADVENLSNYTREILVNLEQLAVISVGSSVVKIQRPSLDAVEKAARDGHLLVIGDPGSGKSGLLHDLADRLRGQGNDLVFLAAEHLEASTVASLRNELSLERGLPELLMEWPGPSVGFLLIDALDAARSGHSVKMLVELIRQTVRLGGRWHVVATIRKFDLRYHTELRNLFSGEPITVPEPDPEFRKVRHLNVLGFDESELAQIQPQCRDLWTLIEHARQYDDQTLYHLLHDPFNLRIAGSLVGAGVSGTDLGPVRSKIELLDRYWDLRVIDSAADSNGHAREALLRIICERMTEKQLLTVDVAETNPSANSPHLDNLKSKKVLIEWRKATQGQPQRNTIAFAHHVLFDYVVERMLLAGTEDEILQQIVRQPSITLSIRPSFVFHFQRNWVKDDKHAEFWDLTTKLIEDAHVPKIGQLIGPAVAVDLATETDDFHLLMTRMSSEYEQQKHAAEEALAYIAGTLLAKNEPLVGAASHCPWCEVVAAFSTHLNVAIAGSVRNLLNVITDKPELLNEDESRATGCAARKLLKFTLNNSDATVRQWLLPVAITSVCRTFDSHRRASSALIRLLLKSRSLEDPSYVSNIWWLAREIGPVLRGDPKLAALTYLCILNSQRPADKPVSFYPSRIMNLSTTLRQNYDMAQHSLTESFRHFLEASPPYALRVLVRVVECYTRKKHGAREEARGYAFDFDGQEAHFIADWSCVWDEGHIYHDDPPVMMLDAFTSYLGDLASNDANRERIRGLVALIVKHNRTAVIWRRLLVVGMKHPETIGKIVHPLLRVPLLLVTPDTCTEAGNLLRRVHPMLADPQKREIEEAILKLPTMEQLRDFSHLERDQARLLGCIPEDSFVTTQAKELARSFAETGQASQNEPVVRFESEGGVYTREDWWRGQGVQIGEPANAKFTAKMEPIHSFDERLLNGVPDHNDVDGILPHLQNQLVALRSANQEGVDPRIIESAVGDLTEACSILLRSDKFLEQGQDLAFVRDVLLDFSTHPSPEYDSAQNDQFDSMPSWGTSPRVCCAEGLMLVSRSATALTTSVRVAIQRLSNDPVNAVRYAVASRLRLLHGTDPDLMWQLIEDRIAHDKSSAVLYALVNNVLHGLTRAHVSRTVLLAKRVFDEVKPTEGRFDPQEACVSLFVAAFVHLNDRPAQEILVALAENVVPYHKQLAHIVTSLRDLLTPTEDGARSDVYLRAWELTTKVCETSTHTWDELNAAFHEQLPPESAREQITRDLEHVARLIDSIAREIYFASKAHNGAQALSGKQKEQFLQSAQRSLDFLQTIGLPSAAHHLVKMLQAFIDIDPKGVFMRIGRVVMSASEKGGYQYESLAADLLADIMGHYIAGHKEIFRQDPECQQLLIKVLDTFVMWPAARKLVYRLEDIYR